MKTRILLYLKLLLWFMNKKMTIRDRKNRVVCPLMLRRFGRFKDELLPCDVPKTRTLMLSSGVLDRCTDGTRCFAREVLQNEASNELGGCRSYAPRESDHFSY